MAEPGTRAHAMALREQAPEPGPTLVAAVRDPHIWLRTAWAWHALFALLLGLVAGVYALRDAGWQSYALLAALGLWYALVGGPAMTRDGDPRGPVYVLGVLPLFAGLAWYQPVSLLLFFGLYPQLFWLLSLGPAVAAVVLVTLAGHASFVVRAGWTRDAVIDGALQGAGNAAFAALLGVWITLIIKQSVHRAELIEELETTRSDLAEAHHREGVMAERERLSLEIHDTLAQGFTSLLMLVRAAETAIETDPATARERLARAERTARENLDEARSLIAALAPGDLGAATLGEAIRRLVEGLGDELGIAASVTVEGSPRPLSVGAEVVLLRATQEALANVRKHAKASSVTARLAFMEGSTRLEVNDDGRGFDPSTATGFGLRGMRARVRQVGGTLEVESVEGRGTTVRVVIP